MTHRTEVHQPTPIEIATKATLDQLRPNAEKAYELCGVARQHGTTLSEFKRIFVLYLHDKSLADWCHDLGIEDATHPNDKPGIDA